MDYFIGHLIGDYILQDDDMAQKKVFNTKKPAESFFVALIHGLLVAAIINICGWYVGCYWAFWQFMVIWLSHTLQDWTRLPAKVMESMGQFSHFKEKFMQAYIWAAILTDNIWHLVLLFFLVPYRLESPGGLESAAMGSSVMALLIWVIYKFFAPNEIDAISEAIRRSSENTEEDRKETEETTEITEQRVKEVNKAIVQKVIGKKKKKKKGKRKGPKAWNHT